MNFELVSECNMCGKYYRFCLYVGKLFSFATPESEWNMVILIHKACVKILDHWNWIAPMYLNAEIYEI